MQFLENTALSILESDNKKFENKIIISSIIRKRVEIAIEPWKKLIIHEVIEYKFDDWVQQIAFSTRSSGGGIPTMQWTNGIVFSPANFPTTNATVEEQLNGILHWASVSFAIKEKFEKQIVKENATINLVDVSVNEIFKELATSLKAQSKYATDKSSKDK